MHVIIRIGPGPVGSVSGYGADDLVSQWGSTIKVISPDMTLDVART